MVQLLNVARRGALVEATLRLRPGTRTTIQLTTGQQECALPAHVVRCRVSKLSPLRYEAGLAFDVPLEGLIDALSGG